MHELGAEFVALQADLRDKAEHEGSQAALLGNNRMGTKLGGLLDTAASTTNFRLFSIATDNQATARRLARAMQRKLPPLPEASGAHAEVDRMVELLKLERKLSTLLEYHPGLAQVVEQAMRSKLTAVMGHVISSSPRADATLDAIENMFAEVETARRANKPLEEIEQGVKSGTAKLQASGGIFGRAAAQIKKNPANLDNPDARTLGNWMAQGNPVHTTEAIRYGFANKSAEVPATEHQELLDKLLKVAEFDTSSVPANTPLLLRESAHREEISENTEAQVRATLIVDQPFLATDPRRLQQTESTPLLQEAAGSQIAVEIEQVPMLLALKYVVCGQEDLVDPAVLRTLDEAQLIQAFSSADPEGAERISSALRHPDNPEMMCLHRKLVAAELMNTFLEGGSALETAKEVLPYAGAGAFMEFIKNFVPDGPLKSLVTELFLGGADLGDNGMGCMSELRSQAKTVKGIDVGGIADLYEQTFGRSDVGMTTMLSHLVLLGAGAAKAESGSMLDNAAKALGFTAPTGELASITETQMQSFLVGSVVSVGMTTLYSAVGALSSNPAILALLGATAIMGTSISPAIGFGILHAELSLAVKKRLLDGTLGAPQSLDLNDHAAVTAFCSKEAMNQLMMQTGNGAGNIAFLMAPLAANAKLLGFAVPEKWIDLFLEPLMPGMENIARVFAMGYHSKSKREIIAQIKEKCIEEAAKGNRKPMDFDEFDEKTLNMFDRLAADWSLKVASPFVRLMGRGDYPHLVPVETSPSET